MEKKHKFTMWYGAGVIIIMMIIQWLFGTLMFRPQIEEVHYSEFMNKIEDGTIRTVNISEQQLSGTEQAKEKDQRSKVYTTVRVEDPTLIETLKNNDVDYYATMQNTWFRNILSTVFPLLIFFFIWRVFFKQYGQSPGAGIMSFGKSKAKVYAEKQTGVTFDDVAGADEAKEELREVIQFLKNPERYSKAGAKLPKGVLLVGPPGTGKTLLAKAVAGEAGVNFFSMSGSDFVEMFVGVGASRVRDLFSQAQQQAPCIIFIDELDAIGKARGITPYSNDEREQTLNQLLSEMDGFSTSKGIVMLAATNRPEILDPALLRPGRFDRQVLVDRPDLKGRYDILKVHTKGIDLADNVDLNRIAAGTPGAVGADLANIVNEALLLSIRKGKDKVHMEDFNEAIERMVAGLEKKNRLINPEEKRRVAYHEVGHAVVGAMRTAEPVHKISIIPRGIGALGYTIQLPTEDRYLMTKTELLSKIAVLLGGRAAEEVFFKDVSTGAQNDLERATDTARRMVTMYGMSERIGLVTLEHPGGRFLQNEQQFNLTKEYGPETAETVDQEVKRVLSENYDEVKKLITENKSKIDRIAAELLKSEVLDEKQFLKLLDKNTAAAK
jgi:cell division protease FtsH